MDLRDTPFRSEPLWVTDPETGEVRYLGRPGKRARLVVEARAEEWDYEEWG